MKDDIKTNPQVFEVVVSIEHLIDGVLIARKDAQGAQGTALHTFVAEAMKQKDEVVRYALKDKRNEDNQSRISELAAVYTACSNGFDITDKGYDAAVKESRQWLKGKGLQASGKPALTEEAKEASRRSRFLMKAIKDGLSGAEADEAYQHEQDKKAMAKEAIPEMAAEVLDFLTNKGFDYTLSREILKASLEMIREAEKVEFKQYAKEQ